MTASDAVAIPITTAEKIGDIGPIHRDINGTNPGGSIRGPFDIKGAKAGSASTYPVLWSHDAERERSMSFEADSEGVARRGRTRSGQAALDIKVASIWSTASHSHVNLDFRFNSQSTGMQFTKSKTIGGRAWISIQLASPELEKALVLWANTSLGMLLRWWHSNKQQSGRGNLGKSTLQTLPVLDVTSLSRKQRAEAVKLFDAMHDQPLLPLNEIDKDLVRKDLDEKFALNVLGLSNKVTGSGGSLELLRLKLSREPSIRGDK